MNSAIFPCLFIVEYFDFSASAGGFDLSLFNMHTISDTSVSNYFMTIVTMQVHLSFYVYNSPDQGSGKITPEFHTFLYSQLLSFKTLHK